MSDRIIENIPRIAQFIGDTSMLTPLIGSLYAALYGLGKPRPYADLLALSGAGNRLCWKPGCWNGGNIDILCCEEDPFAPHHRVLKAVGLRGIVRLASDADEAQARREIIASIDAGVPVIAMGIIGPPECCVVHGYLRDGEALTGWNYFQQDEGFAWDVPFVKDGWYKGLVGYILLSQAEEVPSEKDSAIAAMRAIADHAHHADVRGVKVGFAAWEEMLTQLETADFSDCVQTMLPGPDQMFEDWAWEKTVQGRFFVYCDALCQIFERGAALPFWERMRGENPDWAGPLTEAIDAWRACAQYGGYLWQHVTNDREGYEKFAAPETRKILADEGRRTFALEKEAVAAVEKLLATVQ